MFEAESLKLSGEIQAGRVRAAVTGAEDAKSIQSMPIRVNFTIRRNAAEYDVGLVPLKFMP